MKLVVTNKTNVVLGAKQIWVKGGEAVNRPGDVIPGEEDLVLVTRDSHGNHGTLSYRLGNSTLVLTVMWTSGINCDHYANTLAIGISTNQNTDKFKYRPERSSLLLYELYVFSTMYFEKQSWFRRQNFLFTPEPLVLKAENFQVNAKMIIKPQADVIIIVEELESQ